MGKASPGLYMDPTFSVLVAPRTEEARKEMETRLLQCGNDLPIRVWNNCVLVEQERYLFCRIHDIAFPVKKMHFASVQEATVWVCNNQLRREDIADEMRTYLIGRRAQAERQRTLAKIAQMSNEEPEDMSDVTEKPSIERALAKIGDELQMTSMAVRKYEQYTRTIDRIMLLDPILGQQMLRGKARVSYAQLLKTTKMSDREFVDFLAYYLSGADKRPTVEKFKAGKGGKKGKAAEPAPPVGSIKEMPSYDPDAEVASLALTIPSWVDSMKRTEQASDYSKISGRARKRLICELDSLLGIAERMLYVLYEEDCNE